MIAKSLLLSCGALMLFAGTVAAQPTCVANYPAGECDHPYDDDNMFVGRVVSLSEGDEQERGKVIRGYMRGKAVVSVEMVFSGKVEGVVELKLPQACWGVIEKGNKYIFHVRRMADGLYANKWSGGFDNLPSEDFNEVVEGIRALINGVRQPRIYGTLRRFDSRVVSGGVVVAENGRQKFESVTDARGRYEFRELPDGEYKVNPLLLPSLRPPDGSDRQPREKYDSFARVVNQSLCGERVDFLAWDNGVIGGRVEDADGKPVDYVEISLFNETLNTWPSYPSDKIVLQSREGKFAFINLPPAQYLLKVYARTEDGETLEFYYPGVLRRENARVIDLTAGVQLTDIRLKLPRLKKRRIFGRVYATKQPHKTLSGGVAIRNRPTIRHLLYHAAAHNMNDSSAGTRSLFSND
jgi:hypothetical protein